MTLMTMAAATAEDYARDPTRWGSAEVAAHFPGFEHVDVRTRGAGLGFLTDSAMAEYNPLLYVENHHRLVP